MTRQTCIGIYKPDRDPVIPTASILAASRREHVIYAITHVPSGRRYVGRTVNEAQRIYTHRSNLRCNRHWCPELQNDWNVDGPKAFSFDILERNISSETAAKEREVAYIEALAPTGLYNFRADVDPKTGRLVLIASRRERQSEALRKAWLDPTSLLRIPIRTRWDDPKQRKVQSASQKKRYTDPAERQKTAETTRNGIERLRLAIDPTWKRPIPKGGRWTDPQAKERQAEKMRAYHATRKALLA